MSFNGSTYTFDTISDLKVQIGNSNARVNVLGYATPGDGGGGQFYWDTTSTSADNAGTIFQVTGVTTGRWKRSVSGTSLNVLWFGAVGDDLTVHSSSGNNGIIRTITAAQSLQASGNTVSIYFPNSKGFVIGETLTIPANIGVICDSIIRYTGVNTTPAIICGETNTISNRTDYKLSVINSTLADWNIETYIGIKFINLQFCTIEIVRVESFTILTQFIGDTKGFSYNQIKVNFLINGKIGADLTNKANGWCNENIFYGGRFAGITGSKNGLTRYGIRITSQDGIYTGNNNNNFYSPAFELDAPHASPGEAIPVLVEHGVGNRIMNCRSEDNSPIQIRTQNGSWGNIVEVGVGTNNAVADDQGTVPSSIAKARLSQITSDVYQPVYQSGALTSKVCPYNSTEAYIGDDLFFAITTDGNVYSHTTNITLNSGDIQCPNSRAIGVRIDTSLRKRFVVKTESVSGFSGRVRIRCFDSTGAILSGSSPAYVTYLPSFTLSPSTGFGGSYVIGSDTPIPIYFTVTSSVAYVDVLICGGGTNPVKLKSFEVQCIDGHGSVIKVKDKKGLFATQAPTTGTWSQGTVILSDTPSTGALFAWRCTTAGSPGTWETLNYAPSVGSVNYLQNQALSPQSASYNISGTAIIGGNVGIGTTNPTQKLEVSGNILTNGGTYLVVNNVETFRAINDSGYFSFYNTANITRTGYIQFNNNSSGAIINMEQNYPIDIRTNALSRLFIANTGSVGIGTSTPNTKLEVSGTIRTVDLECTDGAAPDTISYGPLGVTRIANANDNSYIALTRSGQVAHSIGIDANNALILGPSAGGANRTMSKAVSILPNLNVGIGVAIPSSKLEVAGQIKITGGSPGVNKVLVSDADGLASWGNVTPAPATIQGNGNLSAIPADWVTVILNHTSNLGFTSLANYPGGYTGRVVTIINPTNFTFQISSVVYPAQSLVFITWTSPSTPAFTKV